MSDRLLIDLIEHFSQYDLSNKNVDPDLLGNAYEYLIKHFADLTNKKGGRFNNEVWFYKVSGGGHDWPGVWGNKDINASDEIWKFFKQHLK